MFKSKSIFTILAILLITLVHTDMLAGSGKRIYTGDVEDKVYIHYMCYNIPVFTPHCKDCEETQSASTTTSSAGKPYEMLQAICEENTDSSSTVDSRSYSFMNIGNDWSSKGVASGCNSCGSFGNPENGLPDLEVTRFHMPRHMTQQASLGPGVFLNFDMSLKLFAAGSETRVDFLFLQMRIPVDYFSIQPKVVLKIPTTNP